MLLDRAVVVGPVALELLLGERDRPRDRLASVRVQGGALTVAVLDWVDLGRLPPTGELAQDPAVIQGVAVLVVEALPRDQRGEMRGPARGRGPPHHRIVGDPHDPDLAGAPRLEPSPLDRVANVRELLHGAWVEVAGRPSRAP